LVVPDYSGHRPIPKCRNETQDISDLIEGTERYEAVVVADHLARGASIPPAIRRDDVESS
jgi:hypothetical protein